MYEPLSEAAMGILDDAVNKELDAVDDLMSGSCNLPIEDHLIPDELVDKETDSTDFEKYIDKEDK